MAMDWTVFPPLEPSTRDNLLYEQITDRVIDAITAGHLRLGDALPTELEMAAHFKVSRDTVQKACRLLDERGYTTVVSDRVGRRVTEGRPRTSRRHRGEV